MKILWWEQDICSLSACNPSAVDSSALAHLLFFLCSPVFCVCVSLCRCVHGSECMFGVLCWYWCVRIYVSLGCMKWRRQAQVCTEWGVVVRWKTSSGFPRTVFTFCCSGPLGKALGEGRWTRAEGLYTLLALLGSKNISSGLSKQGLVHNGVKQQSWEGASRSSRVSLSQPPSLQRQSCLFWGQGREETREAQQGVFALPELVVSARYIVITAAGRGYISKTVTPYRNSSRMKIRLHKLVSPVNIVSNRAHCAVWHLCTALFSVDTFCFAFFFLKPFFPSLTSLCLTPALLQYRHLSPTWRSQCSLPSPPLSPPSVVPWHPSV